MIARIALIAAAKLFDGVERSDRSRRRKPNPTSVVSPLRRLSRRFTQMHADQNHLAANEREHARISAIDLAKIRVRLRNSRLLHLRSSV